MVVVVRRFSTVWRGCRLQFEVQGAGCRVQGRRPREQLAPVVEETCGRATLDHARRVGGVAYVHERRDENARPPGSDERRLHQ